MTDSPAANSAIEKLLAQYQGMAEQEKAQAPKREAAQQKLDQLVDDMAAMDSFDQNQVNDEMIAAFLIFQQTAMQKAMSGDPSAQMAMAKFDDDFMNSFGDYMDSLNGDEARIQTIENAARALTQDMTPPQIPSSETLFAVAVDEPEEGFGEWTMAFVAIDIDENYNVSLADKLDFDLDVSLEVSPTQSLSDEFNIPGKRYKAGQDFEPFILTHETGEGDNQTQLQVRGHVYENGQRLGELKMPAVPLHKPQNMGMDMEALMRMMENDGLEGPGPNGPPNSNGPNGPN